MKGLRLFALVVAFALAFPLGAFAQSASGAFVNVNMGVVAGKASGLELEVGGNGIFLTYISTTTAAVYGVEISDTSLLDEDVAVITPSFVFGPRPTHDGGEGGGGADSSRGGVLSPVSNHPFHGGERESPLHSSGEVLDDSANRERSSVHRYCGFRRGPQVEERSYEAREVLREGQVGPRERSRPPVRGGRG